VQRAGTDIVGHMNESVQGMRRLLEEIDGTSLTPSQAAQLYRFFDAAESVAVAGMKLVLPIVDEGARLPQ
jgi:hypothetical protein